MLKKLLFAMPLAFGLLLGGCSNGDEETPAPNEKPTVITDFVVAIDELKDSSVSLTVTPPTGVDLYFAFLFSDTKVQMGLSDDELLSSIIKMESFSDLLFSGEQTFTYAGLIGHSHYRMLCVAYDDLLGQFQGDLFRSERITTPDSPEKFGIQVENVTGFSAQVTVTPPYNDLTYYTFAEEMNDYTEDFESNDNLLLQNDYAFWLWWAGSYSMDISEVISADLSTGVREVTTDEWYTILRWDTEYMVYAYGCDEEGNLTVPMTKRTFRTNKPAPSDNTFEIEVSRMEYIDEQTDEGHYYGWDVEVTVKPSNPNDTYYVTITNADWYDWFFSEANTSTPSDEPYIQYTMLKNILQKYYVGSEALPNFLHQGQSTLSTWEDRQLLLSGSKEYGAFVFGVDENGATTETAILRFNLGDQQ